MLLSLPLLINGHQSFCGSSIHIKRSAQEEGEQASLSGETEDVDDHVVVFERVLLTKIAVVFAVPEATGTHVESTVALLQNYHVRRKLKIFIHLLQQLDNHLARIVAPFLGFL